MSRSGDLSRHPHFTPWRDPASGALSYVLSERVAPVQRHFYYTNPSVSADERWLWLACAFPPNPQMTLAVVSLDPDRPFIRHFPQAGFSAASPMVAPAGDAVWFCVGAKVLRLAIDGAVTTLCELDPAWLGGRHLWRLATHLTVSADGRHVALDGHAGNSWFLALGDLRDGTARVVQEWQENHDHAQFHPTDPDQLLIAHDQHRDAISGRFIHHLNRTYLLRTDGTGYRCINPLFRCWPFHGACHEWWTARGTIAYVEYDSGVWEHDPATGLDRHLWREPLCHAHSDPTLRFWCADQSPYTWREKPCAVTFFDQTTGRTRPIASALPFPAVGRDNPYHLDPHPQFSPRGTWVVYTTTAFDGRVDVALAPVAALAAP